MSSSLDRYEDKPTVHEIEPLNIETEHPKKKTFKDGVLQHFRDYCSTCSIHGFAYFGESRTWIEYVWWIIVFVISVCGCMFMIYELYEKWRQTPVLVSFATKNEPIYRIPFPAVTICPINKVKKHVFNLTDFVLSTKPHTEEEIRMADYSGILCDQQWTDSDYKYLNDTDFFDFVNHNSVGLKNFSSVVMKDEIYEFGEFFKETYTQQGLCYTYNRMRLNEMYSDIVVINENGTEDFNASSWDPENQYKKNTHVSTYPRRATSAGIKDGIIITLIEEKNNTDFYCEPLFMGYTVTMHYPCRMPMTKEEYFFLPANQALLVPIEAARTLTSEKIKNYEPEKRDCNFPSERSLKYFRYYTQKNCNLECLTNATYATCGCVEFFMPREKGTPVCGPGSYDCARKVEQDMKNTQLKRKFLKENGESTKDLGEDVCDCLALCSDVVYSANTEPIKLKKEQVKTLVDIFPIDSEGHTFQVSVLLLYFKNDKLHTTERNELYGPSDFISNFGGILGLFTGFSILSCMEIVYFLSLRIFGNIRLFGYWAGPKN